jgi:hypothetical protein
MRAVLRVSFAVLIVFSTFTCVFAGEPIRLTVLYTGNPGSERQREFTNFLEGYFDRVDSLDLRDFRDEKAAGYDVIIIDWTSIFPRDPAGKLLEPVKKLIWPKGATVAQAYNRPTILVGAVGVELVRPLQLKIDNLCNCLGDSAHGIATDHDIFRTPLKVDLSFYDAPTPPQYSALSPDEMVGRTIKAWRVQNKNYPEIDPGMVSSPFGFDDFPDAEIISSGINDKTPGSVAIGRQGNFFLWGFSASPADMTPEARKCFINSVCYINNFDGQKPIAHKTNPWFGREYSLIYAYSVKEFWDDKKLIQMFPLLKQQPQRIAGVVASERKLFEQSFSQAVRDKLGDDPIKYSEWIRENYEWLFPDRSNPDYVQITVDEDVKSLELSNRRPELLTTCVAMIERGERADMAQRLLKRYTTEDFNTAGQWRSWLESARDRIYFDEVGLFKFVAVPQGIKPPPKLPRTRLSARTSPTRQHPVVVECECIPDHVRPGEIFTLVVRIETAPAWHITAVTGSKGPEVATSIDLEMPEKITAIGDWIYPEPILSAGERLIYEGTYEFRRQLRLSSDARAGFQPLACRLSYQACDRFSCKKPTETVTRAVIRAVD